MTVLLDVQVATGISSSTFSIRNPLITAQVMEGNHLLNIHAWPVLPMISLDILGKSYVYAYCAKV